MRYLFVLLLFMSLNSYAEYKDWSDTDQKLFIASQAAISTDWLTTRYGARHRNDTQETNPFLGPHPGVGKVNLYFTGLLISNYFITDYVDPNYRGFYLVVRTTTHGVATINNIHLGWKMSF